MNDKTHQENTDQEQNQQAQQSSNAQSDAAKESSVMDKKAEKIFSQTEEQNKAEQQQAKQEETEKEEKPARTQTQELVYGGKKFSSREEVDRYINFLEEKAVQKKESDEAKKSTVEYQIRGQQQNDKIDKELIDKMYDDPESFVKELQEKVYSTIEQKETVKKNQAQFWESFYNENPVLKNKQRAVQLVMSEQWDKVKDMSTDEAHKYLSKEVKSFIYETTGQKIESEVESKQSAVYTGSGSPAMGVSGKQEQKTENTTFFDEIKQLRKKKA